MICVIPQIRKYSKYCSYNDHKKQVNIFIKTLFYGVPEDEMAITQDIFWNGYTEFDNKNGSFDADEFIRKIKDIRYDNSNLWHKNIHFLTPRLLVLLHAESHQRFLELVQQIVLGVTKR